MRTFLLIILVCMSSCTKNNQELNTSQNYQKLDKMWSYNPNPESYIFVDRATGVPEATRWDSREWFAEDTKKLLFYNPFSFSNSANPTSQLYNNALLYTHNATYNTPSNEYYAYQKAVVKKTAEPLAFSFKVWNSLYGYYRDHLQQIDELIPAKTSNNSSYQVIIRLNVRLRTSNGDYYLRDGEWSGLSSEQIQFTLAPYKYNQETYSWNEKEEECKVVINQIPYDGELHFIFYQPKCNASFVFMQHIGQCAAFSEFELWKLLRI